MNRNRLKYYFDLTKTQLLMLLGGAVLTFWPGSAVELVIKAAGWILIATSVYNLIKASSHRGDRKFWIRTVLFMLLGIMILFNPVTVSRLLGRIVGVLLVIQGVKDLRGVGSRLVGIVTILLGIVLFVVPATLTNALLILMGLLLIVVGTIHLVEKLFRTRRLQEGEDPNIIDAAP